MSNTDSGLLLVLVFGVIGFIAIRVVVEFIWFRRCKECGHQTIFHKSLKFKDRKVIGCRFVDCECYKEEKTPDFLRDCYGMDEHDEEGMMCTEECKQPCQNPKHGVR